MTGLLLPMPSAATVSARNREVSRDLLVVVLATGLTFAICAVFELREWLTEITRPLERYQIDELPFTLGGLALLLAWFSWRRWRQAAQELQLRVAAQQALMDNEARYRMLFMENLAGNALCAPDGTMLLGNFRSNALRTSSVAGAFPAVETRYAIRRLFLTASS